jgi:hypothetical protein
MKGKNYPQRPTERDRDYPLNLALEVRNFIVLTMRRVPSDDQETFRGFLEVISKLERVFDMFE